MNVLRVTIAKTASGAEDYIQIISDDQLSVNVVLIAKTIELRDMRPKGDRR